MSNKFNKLFIVVFLLTLCLCNGAWGEVETVYVSVAGGTYDAGNNSDGSSWANAYTTIQAAYNSLDATDDADTIILDPTDDFVEDDINFAASKDAGSVAIKSATESPTACFITGTDGTATDSLIKGGEANTDFLFKGITFRNHRVTDGDIIPVYFSYFASAGFEDCVFDNIDSDNTADDKQQPIFDLGRYSAAGSDITFDNCTIQNCDRTSVNGNVTGGTLVRARAPADLIVTDSTFSACTAAASGIGSMRGMFYVEGTVTLNGANTFQNLDTSTTTGVAHGVFRIVATGNPVCTISGINVFDNCDVSSTTADVNAAVLSCAGTGTIGGTFELKNCDATTTSGNVTQMLVADSDTGMLTITGPNVLIHDNTAHGDGGIVGISQGGNIILDKIKVYNNTVTNTAAVRLGGWTAGSTIKNSLIYNNTSSAANGGGIYLMLHSTATEDTVHNIYNCTLYGNSATTASNGDGIFVNRDATSGFALTVNVTNCILWNQADNDEIFADSDSTLNVTYSIIRGGTGALTEADSTTGVISYDPLLNGNLIPLNYNKCLLGADVSLTEDFNGDTVPKNGKYPIGAYLPRTRPWMFIDGIVR